MSMFDMYRPKKKKPVDPNAPPRPNLMSHDKKLREQTEAVGRLLQLVERQQDELESLRYKYQQMQISKQFYEQRDRGQFLLL